MPEATRDATPRRLSRSLRIGSASPKALAAVEGSADGTGRAVVLVDVPADDEARHTGRTLLAPPAASPRGTVYLRYGLADGTPATGDMSAPDRGAGSDA
ncbi:hypothetical protein GCM10009730_65210 [Streptomyces albidochromogenes]